MRCKPRKTAAGKPQPTGNGSLRWLAGLLLTALISHSAAFATDAEPPLANPSDPIYQWDLPAQSVADSLSQLSEQADLLLLFPYTVAHQQQARAVQGNYTIQQALHLMLQGTGFSGGLSQKGVLMISLADPSSTDHTRKTEERNMNNASKRSLLAAAIAFVAGGSQGVIAQQNDMAESQSRIDEIVVTATKRGETSLNDTAASIAAIGSEDIKRRGIGGLGDYLRFVPSVSLIDRGVTNIAINIRGISADPEFEAATAGPTVGVYFGEIPMSGLGFEGSVADLQMVDMQRIEILRGPQGTLFGSGSLGGTLRNIPNPPDLQKTEANIRATYSSTAQRGNGNSKMEGVINIPIIDDVLAIRAVAYRFDNSGFVKNIAGSHPTYSDVLTAFGAEELAVDENRVGSSELTGGRIAALWQPTDDLSVNLQYVTQKAEQDGFPDVILGSGDYTQTRIQFSDLVGDGEEMRDDVEIVNLTVQYELDSATLFSSSSWLENENETNRDFSSLLGGVPLAQLVPANGDAFSQELRLVSKLEGPWQYVVGYYHEGTELRTKYDVYFAGPDLMLNPFGAPFGSNSPKLFDSTLSNDVKQNSWFGELSYNFTEQLELTLGFRQFDYERDVNRVSEGIFNVEPVNSIQNVDESGTSLKTNLSYRPSEDLLLYAQWSEGFRLGNANPFIPRSICDVDNDGILDGTGAAIVDGFDSDSLDNYELGAKLTLLENRLQVNAAIYHIDWDGMPINSTSPTCLLSVVRNAGKSRSQGVELDVVYYPIDALRINIGGSYIDAELVEDASGLGVDGDRLPGSPDYNISLGVQYEFDFLNNSAFIRTDYSYISDFYTNLQEAGVSSGDYGKLNFSAGVAIDNISAELFINNATDEDGVTWVASSIFPDQRAWRLRPRTIGLTVSYQF